MTVSLREAYTDDDLFHSSIYKACRACSLAANRNESEKIWAMVWLSLRMKVLVMAVWMLQVISEELLLMWAKSATKKKRENNEPMMV